MPGYVEKIFVRLGVEKNQSETISDLSIFYPLFRIVVSLAFAQHGAQKLLGLLGGIDGVGTTTEAFSLLWFAGMIELIGGLLMALGIFVRLVALFALSAMAYAYFIVHFPQDFFPILNQGELALLYLMSFILILKNGSGRLSLEKMLRGKEIF